MIMQIVGADVYWTEEEGQKPAKENNYRNRREYWLLRG